MNRRLTSLVCASLALLSLVCNGVFAQDQVTVGTDIIGDSGNGTNVTGPAIASPATVSPVLTSPATNGSNGYATHSTIGKPVIGNAMGGYSGYGMTIPPAYAYGECADNRCGVRGWYQRNFGSCFYFDGSYGGGGLGHGDLLGCYGYQYGGLGGCGYRRLCGHRPAYGSCCQAVSAINGPSCCRPTPNCSGALSCGAVMTQPLTVVPTAGSSAPTLLENAISAPATFPVTPVSTKKSPDSGA